MPHSRVVNGAHEAFEGGWEGRVGGGGGHKTFQVPTETTKRTSASFPFHRVITHLFSLCPDQQGL